MSVCSVPTWHHTRYVSTLHAINHGCIKISRLSVAKEVHRGFSGMKVRRRQSPHASPAPLLLEARHARPFSSTLVMDGCLLLTDRGLLPGVKLPESFSVADVDGVRGGGEFGFMSTTASREVALEYTKGQAGDAAPRTLLTAKMNMASRGAYLSFISQVPRDQQQQHTRIGC